MKISELYSMSYKLSRIRRFAEWAIDRIGIENQPKIKYGQDVDKAKSRHTFGSTNGNGDIWVHVGNRNVADCCRTLMHELVHHKQFEDGTAHNNMTEDEEQYIEDEANALAGRLMREYGKKHENIYENKNWSE